MILISSVVMIAAVTLLTYFNIRHSLDNSIAFNEARFENMGAAMGWAIEQQISMMDLTVGELNDNASLMSSLNQFVRDDSEEAKMRTAARNSIQQYLYRSPMVGSFYRVSFYTSSGDFITSRFQKDDYLESGSVKARQVIQALPWLEKADGDPDRRHILALHNDYLSVRRDIQVFGVVQAVMYHDNQLGYIEVSNEISELSGIFSIVDSEVQSVQAVFDDGTVFYSSDQKGITYPLSLPRDMFSVYTPADGSAPKTVMHVYNEWLGLHLFLTQDDGAAAVRSAEIRRTNILIALIIMLPTLLLIVLVTHSLTGSIRALTKKVGQIQVEQVLANKPEAIRALQETETTANDAEIHRLEYVFNDLMLRLRDSAMNEMSLREGALQAQLSALQTQINPHFIYNTLNIISAKSMDSGNLDVIEICDQFATLLRYSTDTRSRTATLKEEIDNVRNYLLLAKARYEDNLEFSIDIPADLTHVTVPKLTLQPLVENALTHGYDGQNQLRRLTISGKKEGPELVLEIRDNGTGFPAEVLTRLRAARKEIEEGKLTLEQTSGHIGLLNTCLRLHYYSNGAMRIRLENSDGAVVRLFFPC